LVARKYTDGGDIAHLACWKLEDGVKALLTEIKFSPSGSGCVESSPTIIYQVSIAIRSWQGGGVVHRRYVDEKKFWFGTSLVRQISWCPLSCAEVKFLVEGSFVVRSLEGTFVQDGQRKLRSPYLQSSSAVME
jgi:hypothetical protein